MTIHPPLADAPASATQDTTASQGAWTGSSELFPDAGFVLDVLDLGGFAAVKAVRPVPQRRTGSTVRCRLPYPGPARRITT